MTRTSVIVQDDAALQVERRGTPDGVPVVLLHAGVADLRGWLGVLDLLEHEPLDLVAVDRRGFGGSSDPSGTAFTHLQDLLDLLDALRIGPAVLVGNSMGGALALDVALTAPERVAALLLIGSAVSGMTDEGERIEWRPDAATGALLEADEAAQRAGDLDERVRVGLHLWLDGPAQPEGRVGGPVRELAAAMQRRALAGDAEAGDAGLDAWHALGDVRAPGVAAWGDLDLPPDLPFYDLTAQRLPRVAARVLPGVAHLPALEDPALVAGLVREVVALAEAPRRAAPGSAP